MVLHDVIGSVLLLSGAFFVLIGSIGVVRLPDFFSRTHASGKCDTLGLALVLLGLAVHEGGTLNTAKLLLIAVFISIANPTATHALARAAFKLGVKPLLSISKKEKQNDLAN